MYICVKYLLQFLYIYFYIYLEFDHEQSGLAIVMKFRNILQHVYSQKYTFECFRENNCYNSVVTLSHFVLYSDI